MQVKLALAKHHKLSGKYRGKYFRNSCRAPLDSANSMCTIESNRAGEKPAGSLTIWAEVICGGSGVAARWLGGQSFQFSVFGFEKLQTGQELPGAPPLSRRGVMQKSGRQKLQVWAGEEFVARREPTFASRIFSVRRAACVSWPVKVVRRGNHFLPVPQERPAYAGRSPVFSRPRRAVGVPPFRFWAV